MNSTERTSQRRLLIRRMAVVMVLVNIVLISLFLVVVKNYLHHKVYYLTLLETQLEKVNEMSVELESFHLRAAILKVLEKRALGISEQDYLSIVDTLMNQQQMYGYSPALLLALIQVESSFNNYAVSPKGAIGLMQLQPVTAEYLCVNLDIPWEGPHDLFDPHLNIRLGSYYLSLLHKRFDDLNCALEAYNKGPTRVSYQLASGIRVRGVYSKHIGRYSIEFGEKIGKS